MAGAQGAPFGDALLAGVALGVFDSYRLVKDWLEFSEHTYVNQDRHALYMQLFEVYLSLYESLQPDYEKLNAVYAAECAPAD